MKLSGQEVNNLYNSLGPQTKKVVQSTYAKLRSDSPEIARPKNSKDVEPRDLAVIIFICVRRGVIVERIRIEGKLFAQDLDP